MEKFLDDIKTVVHDGEELLKASAREIKGKAVAGARSTDQLVRSHPYQTIGIMLGLGLIVGLAATALLSGEESEDESA
jgi:Uncharacterized conserved protein